MDNLSPGDEEIFIMNRPRTFSESLSLYSELNLASIVSKQRRRFRIVVDEAFPLNTVVKRVPAG